MPELSVSGMPHQRSPVEPPSPLPFERGSNDGHIHAIRKTLGGPRAVCDPTLVLVRLGGRFDYDDLNSCLRCIIDTAHRTITLP